MRETDIRGIQPAPLPHKNGKDALGSIAVTADASISSALPIAATSSVSSSSGIRTAPHLDRAFDEDGLLHEGRFAELEVQLIAAERWVDLVDLYAVAAQRAPDAELGRRMLLSAGLLCLEKLDDPRQAEPFLRRVLASDPENLDALDACRAMCVAAGRHEEAADLLDHSIAAIGDHEKPDLLIALADIAYRELDQVERAVTALRFAYQCVPDRIEVLVDARRIFIEEERWEDAKRVLDDEAARVLGPQARPSGVYGDAPEKTIAEAYRQLGVRLLESASLHRLAEACLERARELGDNEALSKLDELAHIRKDWEAHAKALRDEAIEMREKRKAGQLYLRAAEVYHTYGKDPIRADEYVERCLLLCPGHEPALDFIESTHKEQGRQEDLARKLNAMAAAVKDPSIKVEILLRVAHLLEESAHALPAAEGGELVPPSADKIALVINAYRRALAIDPGHRLAVHRLALILEELRLNADRAQILEGHLAAVDNDYLKLQAHLELGRLYAEMLGDSQRARAHFEAALALNPTHFEAASALRALYKDGGELQLQLAILKVLVEYTPDLFSRLEILYELAEVAEKVSREEAFSVYRKIFELDPNAKEAESRLSALAHELHRYQALADAISSAAKTRGGDRAADLWIQAARLYDAHLPRPLDAIAAYKRALEIRPDDTESRDALERLLRQQDDPAALVEVLRSQLARKPDPAEEPLLLAKIAGVLDRDLGDLDGAISTFQRVLELQPNNMAALANLDDLYRRREDWPGLASILVRREALAETPSDLAELQCRRARVLDERLARREQAAELYLEVLSAFPDHAEVIHALSKLLLDSVMPLPIARALEPLFGQRGQFLRQLAMLNVLLQHETDPKIRRDLAKRGSQISEQRVSDDDTAFDMIVTAFEADPSNEEIKDTFLRLMQKTSSEARGAEVLHGILSTVTLAPPVVSTLAVGLAEIYDAVLADKKRAIELYQHALRSDGGNAVAIAALERLLGAEERWAELAALLQDRMTRSTETQAKVNLGLSLAAIKDQRLGDTNGAIDAYREVLSVEPAETTALAKLAEALERQERHRELVSVLDRMRDTSPDPDVQAMTEVKAGDVLRTRLRDRTAALERYRSALSRNQDSPGAIRGLEALLEDIEMRPHAGMLLEPHYAKAERWPDLVLSLESQLSAATGDPERRRTLFLRIAEIEADRLEQPEAAFSTLSRAFRESLIRAEDRPRLQQLALAARHARDLAQLYEDALAAKSFDPDLLREQARLFDGDAADPARARASWERLLQHQPGDAEALEALERLHAAGDNPAALAEILVVRAGASTGAERVGYLKRAAAIYEEVAEDLPRAIEVVELARQENPQDRTTLQDLERLYQLAGRTDRVRDMLELQTRLVEEPLQKANVLVRLAECSAALERYDEAVAAFQAALHAMPDHKVAREGLEKLLDTPVGSKAALALEPIYRAAGDWSHLVEAYEILAHVSRDPTERVERLVAIRSIWEERLGRLDRAFDAAVRAYKEAPRNEELLVQLERLGRLSGSVQQMLAILEDQADQLPYVSQERYEVRIRIARFTETLLRDRASALEAWKLVLEERPDSLIALEALERLYTRSGEARELVEVLRTMAGILEDPAHRTPHLRRAAQILDEKLGDRAQASRLYEHVLTLAPADLEVLRKLDAIYSETRAYEELATILGRQIAAAGSPAEKSQLLLRLGRLRKSALQDPRGALAAYMAVLDAEAHRDAHDNAIRAVDELIEEQKGSNPEIAALAAELVEPHWAAKNDYIKVVSAKEARVAVATEPTARKALLFDIASTYETNLDQPEMAFLALARAYGEWPADVELAAALERLAVAAQTEEELAEIYAQALLAIEDDDLALQLARKVAYIYDNRLERGEAAVPYYDRVLSIIPDDAGALRALERIHRRLGNAARLVDTYRGMLKLAGDDKEQQKNIWKEIALIMEGDLRDADGAFEAYREMIALDPNDPTALRAMGALCERSGRLDELAIVLRREAEISTRPDDKAQVLLRLGMLRKERLGDPHGAVQAFAQVLEIRKEDPGAIAGLAAIAREGGEARPKAAAALAPVYQASGAFSDYIACLEAQISGSQRAEEKKELYVRISDVYEHRLGRPEHALTYACRALHQDLGDVALRAQIERLARDNNLMEDLAAFYLDEIDLVADHDLALALRRRVAEIYDKNSEDFPRAIAEYTKILDVAPGDPAALRALERLYRAAGSFGSLAEVYRRRIAQAEEPSARARLLREFARLQADELKDSPGAIATLRRLLDIEPSDVDALRRLAKLCAEQGRASELADVLQRLIAAADPGSEIQVDAKFRLGSLKAEKLGDLGGAEVLFREVLDADPRHEETRDYLQERFENALAEDHTQIAQALGEILASAMRRSGEWQDLISVLRVCAGLATTTFDRVQLNREIAAVYRLKLKQPELAFTTLTQVFRDAPGLEEVRLELEELADELVMIEELVEALESSLASIPDSELSGDVERRIAQLVESKIGDRERAAIAWQRVLSRRPMDPEALEALDRLDLALARWSDLTEVLEKRVELAGGDEDLKHELLLRLASTWDERLGEREEAVQGYRKARALKPRDKETLLALSRLVDPNEGARELYAVLEVLADGAQSQSELVRHLPRMAALAAGPLEQRPLAIDLWRRVLTIEPNHTEALKALDQLYEAEARWQELADHLERQLAGARDEKELVRIQRRLGLIRGTRLGSIDEAVRAWSEILKRNPNDVEALNTLRTVYRNAKRYDELVATLRKLIPLQLDAEGVKSIRFELAEVFLTNLNQREEAIESAKRALDVEPHTEPELMRLEEIFIATGAYGEAVKVMNARVELADRPSEKVDILFDIAQTYETRIGRRAGAASAYEKILLLQPTSVKAYDALAGIYESNGDYRKLVELHNRRLEITEEVEERRRLLFESIEIQERWLGQPELAFSAACRAFAEEGADEKAQALAERLAEESDNWEILASVFEEQVEQVSVARAVDLRRRLGEIYLEHLKEPARAEHQLELVLSARPSDEVARGHLIKILESQGRWRDLINQIHDQIELVTEPEMKKALYRRIASIEETKLQDVEGAISSTKRILDLDPADLSALSELVRIFRGSEKWHPLIGALTRQFELASEDQERVRLRFEIATVFDRGIGDAEHAIEAYRDVLVVDPNHLPSLKALEQIFTQQERWVELVEVFERQVALARDADQAIQILTRIAGIWEEQFHDLEAGSATLIRILEIEPEHLPTVRSLERIWRAAGDWERLIEAQKRHIELTEDTKESVDLYLSTGDIHLRELGRIDQAEEAYQAALEFDPASKPAIHALGQLYERSGNWFNALEMLQKEANLGGATEETVELLFRMGKINEDMLMDRDAAKSAYTRALNLDPSYTPAMRSLRHIYGDQDEHGEVVALLSQEAEHTEDKNERAQLYQQAAETTIDELDDVTRATKLYEQSLESAPDHVPSLRALGDLYFADEAWEKAEKLLVRLIDKLDRHDDLQELCRQHYRLAYIAEKLDDDHRALKHYLASYELDSTYLPTLEGLAAALLRAERWEDAQRIFNTILLRHKSSLTDAEVVDLHFQLGELAVRLEQHDRAKKSFEKALDLDADHVPTLRASAKLAEGVEEWEESYDLRERLIVLLDGKEKFDELVSQAKLCRDKIQEPYRAIDAFSEARRIEPKDKEVLRGLVKLFGETSQTQRTIDALVDLTESTEDQTEKRDIYYDLADAYNEQRSTPMAVDALNRALDLDPMFIKAFERIEKILFDGRDWKALEENYHRMIQRMPKEQKAARIVLWRSLGDLYHRVLKNDEGARVAYEVVIKLNPEANDVVMLLANLYSKSRETAPKGVELYHRLLPAAEEPAVVARRLFELYSELGQLDKAFCALSALLLMRAATADEQKAYQLLLKKTPTGAKRSLTDNLWRTVVLEPACRSSIADICSVLYRGAPELFGESQKALQLKKKERVDLTDAGKSSRVRLRYFDVWQRLANAMHVGEVEHYHRVGSTQAPKLYPGLPPVLFVGEQHEAFKEMPPRQIAWIVARQMATGRPELALAWALPPDELAAALEAAILLFSPDGSGIDLRIDPRAVQDWLKAFRRTIVPNERARKALRDPVVTCLERREMRHLSRFLEGAEHSASRAALLMAGDVAVVERGLGDSEPLVDVSFRARVRALMLYTLSEDYFVLREKLGLAIT